MGKNIALVFDADFTLMEGYHPSIILEKRGVNIPKFWEKVSSLQKIEKDNGEKTNVDIIYLANFMHEIRYGRLKGLTLEEIKENGKYLDKMFYPGIPEFFDKLKANTKNKLSFNIVSVGIKPLLEGSALGKYMDQIFGYTFFDNLTPGNAIDEIKSTTSSSEKVSSIVSISYGNSEKDFEYPIKDMIYFGDGQTDVPAFRFVKKRNGTSICVYDPNKEGSYEKALKLKDSVNYVLPADYREGSELWNFVLQIINKD